MADEVRMVAAKWSWSRNRDLLDGASFAADVAEWDFAAAQWEKGLVCRDIGGIWEPVEEKYKGFSYEEYTSPRPNPKDYMPLWTPEQRTHYQYFHDGAPVSKIFETIPQLAKEIAMNIEQHGSYSKALGTIYHSLADGPYAELYFSGALTGQLKENPLLTPGKPFRINPADLRLMPEHSPFAHADLGRVGMEKLVAKLNRLADQSARSEYFYYADPLRYLAQVSVQSAKEKVQAAQHDAEKVLKEYNFKDNIVPLAFTEYPDLRIAALPDNLMQIASSSFAVALQEQQEAQALAAVRKR